MATVEKIVLAGAGYTVALVLDDVAKTLTAVHGISTGVVPHVFYYIFSGVRDTRTLTAGQNLTITLGTPVPYTEPVNWKGQTGIVVTGLDGYGIQS